MNEPQTFRTQLSGFHRGDVAEYIQRTAREHQQELRRLQEELTREREEKEQLLRQLASVQGQPQAAPQPKPAVTQEESEALELAAYRRAEAAERTAMQRIRKQTEKLEKLMQDIRKAYSAAGAELGQLSEAVKQDTGRMQEIFAGLNRELEKSKTTMEALRAEAET